MKRNVKVEVRDNKEARAIEVALRDPALKATAITIGLLMPLDDGEKRRILAYLQDRVNDQTAWEPRP